MKMNTIRRRGLTTAGLLSAVALPALFLLATASEGQDDASKGIRVKAVQGGAEGRSPKGVMVLPSGGHWLVPDMVYQGDATCSSASCHGSDEAKLQSGQKIGNESTIFTSDGQDGDPHSRSWKTLASAESKAIAAKLKIESAQTSDQCLSCHALDVPAAQRGEKHDITTGNSCESCHGPAQKWIQPHAKAGWTAAERAKLGTDGLLTTHGLLDTSDLVLRAQMCVACHLQIDNSLIEAGHPTLQFEMYGYNTYNFDKVYTPHWSEAKGRGVYATQWAVGQATALLAAKDSGDRALLAIYEQGLAIATKHFGANDAPGLAKANVTGAMCAATAADLAAAAENATSDLHRKLLAYGVMAMAEAAADLKNARPTEATWDAFDVAASGKGGADYVAAVKAIAEAAK